MISVDGLTVEFGGTTLFSDISFQINEKDRIALMGKNGAGKSTLLKILAGVRQPSRGKVSAPKDCVIAYLPQHLMTEDGRTVFEEASQAFSHLHVMEAEIEAINKELETRTDYESDSYMELIEKVSAMSEKFYSIDLTHFEEDVEKALLGLGFMREDFNRPTSDFSGGWRMRIELAKLLLQNPDVLLLDEPTNHLDIESIQWLEDFLVNSAKAVIVISHDRKFVDNITTRTIEVTMGRIYDYKVNYSPISIDINKVQKGDEAEFRLLFNLFYPRLMSVACRFVPEHIAEDIVQSVFVMYWEQKSTLTPNAIHSFLYKCTQNNCLNYLKHQAVVLGHEEEVRLAEERMAFQLAGSDANELWNEVVERDIRKLLEASISKLPPKCRQAFELSYFKEMTYKEIAEAMHISSRTVEEHVQKATKFLREDLKEVLFCLLFLLR